MGAARFLDAEAVADDESRPLGWCIDLAAKVQELPGASLGECLLGGHATLPGLAANLTLAN